MNQKNLLIASVIANVLLIVLIFVVKKDAADQAKETVTKKCVPMQEAARQCNDIVQNNNLLWAIIDSTWKSPDKSKAFVKKFADSQKLPRCNGKFCTGTEDEARLKTIISNNAKERSITVGWGSGKDNIKYSFKVIYDDKDNFASMHINDLLGKTSNEVLGGTEAEIEDEEKEE